MYNTTFARIVVHMESLLRIGQQFVPPLHMSIILGQGMQINPVWSLIEEHIYKLLDSISIT